MGKKVTVFICSSCGAQSPKWSGRCLECGKWGTLTEDVLDTKAKDKKSMNSSQAAELIDLKNIQTEKMSRQKTGISEIDRVFGGGLVPGSLVLLTGEPGIGKSTILLEITNALGTKEKPVAYLSGEESSWQVKSRTERLGVDLDNLKFITDNNIDKVIAAVKKEKLNFLIVDSIQTVFTEQAEQEIGSITQIRACTTELLRLAKQENVTVIIVGHVTKDGAVAGPKQLEHIVDVVVNLETQKRGDFRVLRAQKNRFGSVNEIGIFTMKAEGLKEIKNPSVIFLDTESEVQPGTVTSIVMEGTRPFLIEIQALVTKTIFGYPQRKVSGYDANRLQVLAAVLEKRAGLKLMNQDIILNVVGGMKAIEPALDLAVSAAIISSVLNQKIPKTTVVFGEVGLGGELRLVAKIQDRLKEISRQGYKEVIVPDMKVSAKTLKINKIKNLQELVSFLT